MGRVTQMVKVTGMNDLLKRGSFGRLSRLLIQNCDVMTAPMPGMVAHQGDPLNASRPEAKARVIVARVYRWSLVLKTLFGRFGIELNRCWAWVAEMFRRSPTVLSFIYPT